MADSNPFGLDAETMAGFFDEAGTHIATLNERLLAAESGEVGAEAVAEMFRAAHSLKGAAAFLQLEDIAQVTHRMESILDAVRHGQMAFSSSIIDVLFQSFDCVSALLAGVAGSAEADAIDTAPIIALLETTLNSAGAEVPKSAVEPIAPAEADPIEEALVEVDPLEEHFGILPTWMRGRLQEDDACEALFAMADGATPVALRFAGEDLLGYARGPALALRSIASLGKVQRIIHLLAGPEDLWAPLRSYRLHIGLLWFCQADDVQRCLKELEVPMGQAWILGPGDEEPQPMDIGRDPAQDGGSNRLRVKSDMRSQISAWLSSTRDDLAGLDHALLRLEQEPTHGEHLDEAFRHLHTIKGASAIMGLDGMARLAHQGEHLLAAVRDGRLQLSSEAIGDCFTTKDLLEECCRRVETNEEEGPDASALEAALRRHLAASAPVGAGLPRWQPSAAELEAAQVAAGDRPLWCLRAALAANAPLPDLRYGMILSNLGRVAEVISATPNLEQLQAGMDDPPPLRALIASEASQRQLVEAIECDYLRDWAIDPIAKANAPAPSTAERAPANGRRPMNDAPVAANADTVRVEASRLDELLNTAGELAISKARLLQQVERLITLVDGVDLRRWERLLAGQSCETGLGHLREAQEIVRSARDTAMDLHRHSSALQQSVMQARMVPIGPLFQRFHRLVRDIGKDRGRSARLVTQGDATELDKKLIDELADPLTHLIRNAVDHGLESPEDRLAAGKDEQGTVRLAAFHAGGTICIQISDDGRGLAVERIRAKAVERGLVAADVAERLPAAEVFQFIFLPGFSTAATVSNVSGRGVGMDIVRSRINELKGSISMESEPGVGTTFTISLPLTLAMIDSLLVRMGGARYAFPLDAVREIIEIPRSAVRSIEGRGRVIHLRDGFISLLDPQQVLGTDPLQQQGDVLRAVIARSAGEMLAVAVDEVIGDEEIVVKPLGPEFAQVRGVSGATVLGDGGLALIIDVTGMRDLARERRAPEIRQLQGAQHA